MTERRGREGEADALAQAALRIEQPPGSYAGESRYTYLEYEAVLGNASIGIAFTRDRRFFLCNPKFAELFGWDPEALIGQPGEVIYASRESYEALGRIAVPLLTAGQQLDTEWEMRRRDGRSFVCRIIAKAIDPANTQHGTIWLAEDVTERKRAADEIDRLVREQQAIFESAAVGIVFLKDRLILRCNRRFEELFGYGPGELFGRSTRILYASGEAFEAQGRVYEKLWAGETGFSEAQMVRKDGSTFWCSHSGRAVNRDDPAQGSVWLYDDITAERAAEQRLRSALSEQELILENATVGISFVRNRVIQRVNAKLAEMTGYSPAELQGQNTLILFARREDWEKAGAELYRGGIAPGGVAEGERLFRRKDGTLFRCRARGRRIDPGNADAQEWIYSYEDVTAEREAEEKLRAALAEHQATLDNATVGIATVRDGAFLRCNRRLEEMFRYGPGEMTGKNVAVTYFGEEEFKAGYRARQRALPTGENYSDERRARRKDGSSFWCKVIGRAIDPGRLEMGAVWIYDDVTADRAVRGELERTLAEQELILDNATVGIAFVRRREFQRCNPRFHEMFGYAPGELVGRSTSVLFETEAEFERAGREAYRPLQSEASYQGEWVQKHKDGTPLWCKVVGKAVDPERPNEGSIWIFEDVTAEHSTRQALERAVTERTAELKAANEKLEAQIAERKQAEERAQHLADHDALTGLPNRRLLEDRLTQALALSYRNRRITAVMFVDLDRFKTINDSLGHAAGDALLKEVARRLTNLMREGDTICRIGGDEFVLVLPELKRASDAASVAQKVIEHISRPVAIDDRDITVTPSIGISVFPEDGRDAGTLIRNADAAMYHAKEMGRANCQFFTDQMNLAASRRLAWESDLRRALQKGELRVHYQPIIELGAGCVAGHEALVRWQHPLRGLVPPAEFIQIAEETGLILKMGNWVLEEACRWATFIGAEQGLPIAVNLSPRQFMDPKLVETVAHVLKETGLPARLLELEITESTAMQHTDVVLATMTRLKELGVAIVIDDFGTGYSSLSYLKRFPVDKLKIDKSFFAEVPENREHKAIVAAITALAHALDLKVVAEGVETEAQLDFAQRCKCDYIQGYLAGPPADATTAAKDYV